ncbi:Phospholipase D1, partial [Rhizopus stolonifer]
PTKEDLNTPLDFDPKIQWHKVLKKLNKYHHDDTQEEDDSVDEKDPVNNVYEMQRIEDDALPSTEEMHQSSEEDIEARNNWGKTLDKVRLIANLHTIPQKSSDKMMLDPIPTLAPYCPPLFDPPFIALTKNQHGNPWPPVLLPFLKVAITDSELNTQGINQWIFRIELQYGDIKWVIKRTIADFINLHYVLKFKRRINDAVPNPPSFPSQFESWLNSAKGTIIPEERGEERYQIAFKRRRALTQYLQKLILRAHMRASDDICEFFEISAVSMLEDMGWKGKEGYMEKKVNFVVPRLCHVLKPHLWSVQWVILRDSYVAFISQVISTTVTDVFMFDKILEISLGGSKLRGVGEK